MPINSPIQLFIGQKPPEAAPPELQLYLGPIYNAIQQLQQAFIQFAGVAQLPSEDWTQAAPANSILQQNMGRCYGRAVETLAEGAAINVHADGSGGFEFRNANATTNSKPAHGFCSATGGIASAAYGECILGGGICTSLSGLSIGVPYFLSTTNGLITTTAPSAVGNIEQFVGFAFTSTVFLFSIHYWKNPILYGG